MGALVDQFVHETSPQLAPELRLSTREYDASVEQEFPAVAAGVHGIPPLVAYVTPVAARLEASIRSSPRSIRCRSPDCH